jgi:acyl dehydratase
MEALKVGDRHAFETIITGDMVDAFAALTGDFSTLHMDTAFARKRGFTDRVVHGILLTGLVSRLIGMEFPGENALLQSVGIRFVHPAYIDRRFRIEAVIDQLSTSTRAVTMKVKIFECLTDTCVAQGSVQAGVADAPEKSNDAALEIDG